MGRKKLWWSCPDIYGDTVYNWKCWLDQSFFGSPNCVCQILICYYSVDSAISPTHWFLQWLRRHPIDQYSLMSGQLLIVGDYNWDCNEKVITKRLIDLLDSTNLVQHVSEPTHRDSHIIDLAGTHQNYNIIHMTSTHSMISDHTHSSEYV